jgi:hypothetical protein
MHPKRKSTVVVVVIVFCCFTVSDLFLQSEINGSDKVLFLKKMGMAQKEAKVV